MRFTGSLTLDAIVQNLKVISTSISCRELQNSCQFNQICFEINKIDYTNSCRELHNSCQFNQICFEINKVDYTNFLM